MKRLLFTVLVVIGIIAIVGCAQKQVTQAPEQPKVVAPAPQAEAPVVTQQPAPVQSEEVKEAPKELQIAVEDIHFDFDKSDIKAEAKPVLENLAKMLSSSANHVVIEGNCDERGTSEYNLALGERRADSAKSFLMSLGITADRIKTISYGKEKPLCTESTEECWARNRRDHFVMTEAK